jgi:hypothetical protein
MNRKDNLFVLGDLQNVVWQQSYCPRSDHKHTFLLFSQGINNMQLWENIGHYTISKCLSHIQ